MSNNFYINCDKLDVIPKINKQNWLFELDFLVKFLKSRAKVLQVGCMDGTRIISLLKKRPDLDVTGLDIEKELLEIAKKNFKKANLRAKLVQSDITKPQYLGHYDYVICLNNTLGYIEEEDVAIQNMKNLGTTVIISVYGEKFTDESGKDYLKAIGLDVDKVENNIFYTKDFGNVRRFTRAEVAKWGGKVKVTPLGYLSYYTELEFKKELQL